MKFLVPHNPEWTVRYQSEAEQLSIALGEVCSSIHHIGSTAIPDILAKPIIDILIEISSLEALDFHISNLTSIGYTARGEYGIPGRRYFKKHDLNGSPLVNLHSYLKQSHQVRRHLAFRDFLLAHPEFAHEYSELKKSLADINGRLPDTYQDAKQPFIEKVLAKAGL